MQPLSFPVPAHSFLARKSCTLMKAKSKNTFSFSSPLFCFSTFLMLSHHYLTLTQHRRHTHLSFRRRFLNSDAINHHPTTTTFLLFSLILLHLLISIIIRSKFFFLFIGREPTTWPANKCLQIMVCSCAMPSNCVRLQIIFCICLKETVLFSFLRSLLRENDTSLRFPRIFIEKTNSVIEW